MSAYLTKKQTARCRVENSDFDFPKEKKKKKKKNKFNANKCQLSHHELRIHKSRVNSPK